MPLAQTLRHPLLALAEPVALLLLRAGRAQGGARKAAGNLGETVAYFHLRRNGYLVVARQWRAPNLDGEVDLIAWHGETLCFVEVKTRGKTDQYTPEYAIDAAKRKALRRMAAAYVHGLPWHGEQEPQPTVRFDTVSVVLDRKPYRVELQPGAFT